MDSVVAFLEKLVVDFSWKRLGFLVALLVLVLVGLWIFEELSGNYKSARMKFGVEHLVRLSDPELIKNIKGDVELEKSHSRMKSDLDIFLDNSRLNSTIPFPLIKSVAAAFPWLLLIFLFRLISDKEDFRGVAIGTLIVATPFILIGSVIPTFDNNLINYIVYPFSSATTVVSLMLIWQKIKRKK